MKSGSTPILTTPNSSLWAAWESPAISIIITEPSQKQNCVSSNFIPQADRAADFSSLDTRTRQPALGTLLLRLYVNCTSTTLTRLTSSRIFRAHSQGGIPTLLCEWNLSLF